MLGIRFSQRPAPAFEKIPLSLVLGERNRSAVRERRLRSSAHPTQQVGADGVVQSITIQIQTVDQSERKIYVALTKDQIKNSPEFDKDKHVGDVGYHEQVGGYYENHRA